jgi:hypothetical protein
MQKKKTAYVSPDIAGILSLFDPALDWSADLSGDEYATALKEFLVVHQEGSQDPRKDSEIETDVLQGIREEYNRVRKNKDLEYSVKKTKIKGNKFFDKDAPKNPRHENPDISQIFNTENIKPADTDPESQTDQSSALIPKRLDGIADSVESIATLLRRQLGLQQKQQRDAQVKQDQINKQDREDDLEKKPDDKKTGGLPKAITKPALGFFERIKKFFLNIVIGAGVVKLFDWLKDPANAEKIEKFSNFLINNAGWILGGLAALALLPVLSSIMGVLGALKGGLLLLKPALALLFSPAGLAALALAAGLGGTLLAMKTLFDKGRDLATGGKNFTAKHESLDERLKKAGMNRGGVVGKETHRGFRKTGTTRSAEQEELFQEVQAERKRLNDLHTAMDNEVRYKIAITPHDVPAKRNGREKSKVSQSKKDEIKTKVEAKYNKMIQSGEVAPKEFLTKESTNLLIEKHKKTGETFSSSEDKISDEQTSEIIDKNIKSNTISDEQTSATIDKDIKPNTNVPGPSNKNNGGETLVIPGGGGQAQSGGGGGGDSQSSSVPRINSVDVQNTQTVATQAQYNKVTVD